MTRQAESLLRQVAASAWGTIAQSILTEVDSARLMGITSRGVFLKTEPKWMIFLSYEGNRGPMTVNLRGEIPSSRELTPGGLVRITPGGLTIPEADVQVSTSEATIWEPHPPAIQAFRPAECVTRLKTFSQGAYRQKKAAGLSDLLPRLLELPRENDQPNVIARDFQEAILSLDISDLSSAVEKLDHILGRGAGLTPSGDDFLIGLLLTLNRWTVILDWAQSTKVDFVRQPRIYSMAEQLLNFNEQVILNFNEQVLLNFNEQVLLNFNEQVIQAAYAKTTTLSANLIECAAQGLADERLIAALDYLMAGLGDEREMIHGLLDWGSSSGVDALVGMLVASKGFVGVK